MDLWLMFYPFISIMGICKAQWANWALRPSTVTLSWCHIKSILQYLYQPCGDNFGAAEMTPPASPAGSPHLLVKAEQMFSWCSLSCLSELEPAPDSERLPYGVMTFISTWLVKQMRVCDKPVSCALMSCTPQRWMDICAEGGEELPFFITRTRWDSLLLSTTLAFSDSYSVSTGGLGSVSDYNVLLGNMLSCAATSKMLLALRWCHGHRGGPIYLSPTFHGPWTFHSSLVQSFHGGKYSRLMALPDLMGVIMDALWEVLLN